MKAPDAVLAGDGLLRALRPDRFLLLDFSADGAVKDPGSARVEAVSAAQRHTGPWAGVHAALIRPDGHVAHAVDVDDPGVAGLSDAVAAWTRREMSAHT